MPIDSNAQGLTLQERRFLAEVKLKGSWQNAAKSLGMSLQAARALFRNDAFRKEYDTFFNSEEIQTVERELKMVATDAAQILEDAKNAEINKKVIATCPACSKKFNVFVQVIDWSVKLRVAELLLKSVGILKDQRSLKVEGSVQHNHTFTPLTSAQRLAYERLNMGYPIPQHMYKILEDIAKQDGFELPALPEGRPDAVEGEFHEVNTSSEQQHNSDSLLPDEQ